MSASCAGAPRLRAWVRSLCPPLLLLFHAACLEHGLLTAVAAALGILRIWKLLPDWREADR